MRGCGCHTTEGFVHVSCLAEQAKILRKEAEENNKASQWHRWYTCSLCEQNYYGVVRCALGWACWKTYLNDSDKTRVVSAMTQLGNGLGQANKHEERIAIIETQLSTILRLWPQNELDALDMKHNLARCYLPTGRYEEAARLFRLVHARRKVLAGATDKGTILAAHQLARTLLELGRYDQVKSLALPLLRQLIPTSLNGQSIRLVYAKALYRTAGASRGEVFEAVAIFEELRCKLRRVLGPSHPDTLDDLRELDRAWMILEDYRKFKL